jgi:hypothetical protein
MTIRSTAVRVASVFVLCAPLFAQTPQKTTPQAKPVAKTIVVSREARVALIRRAQLWHPTDVASMNLKTGPAGHGAFAPGEAVTCTYVDKKLSGRTPKFACDLGDGDELKVKYGADNGEVEGEVAATRLLWALGFGADRMYSVRLICLGCPAALGGVPRQDGAMVFDPAAVERKLPGREIEAQGLPGWSWEELDLVDPRAGGAPLEQRDALKLLAVLMQHTDSKPEQQRLLCIDEKSEKENDAETCASPLLMINDVGLTFGQASLLNSNEKSSPNFDRWAKTPIWRNDKGCEAVLNPSLTGTLGNPVISEAGRQFLSGLLMRLSDKQLNDLFDAARFDVRPRHPGQVGSAPASISEWVTVFKVKREQIATRHCDA